jgi:hypothetical protein
MNQVDDCKLPEAVRFTIVRKEKAIIKFPLLVVVVVVVV